MNDRALVFFNVVYDNFLLAASHAPVIKVFYRLADAVLCLQFVSNAMLNIISPALKHLEIDACDTCDLTICLWDSASTRTPSVTLPTSNDHYALRGEVIPYNSDRIYTVVDIHTKTLNVLDKTRRLALYWITDARQLPWWVSGSPLSLILHWWYRSRNYQLTHAAVVGNKNGGILLAGKSGSGKSTTALSCMKAGMQVLSEDYGLLSDTPNVSAYAVYNSAKINAQTLTWFPELEKHVSNATRAEEDKAFFYHHQFQPEKILYHCPVRAMVDLKIEKTKDSWIEHIESSSVMPALLISTMWQLTHTGLVVLNHLKRLTEALPCYRLHLGCDLMQAPTLLERLL